MKSLTELQPERRKNMNGLTAKEIHDLMGDCEDFLIFDGMVKTNSIINKPEYKNIMCSISGGSDSDIMLDICHKLDVDKKIHYVWFDTGIEYQATKDHLKYLEQKYGIEIEREKAIKSIPYSARHNGQPFVSKWVSQMIHQLQKNNFQWEDEDFETLVKRYCRKADAEKKKKFDEMLADGTKPYGWKNVDADWYVGCISALEWWCNVKNEANGKPSRFAIAQNTWLKEFILQNPPTFNVSAICCKYAKKDVAKKYVKDHHIDLSIMGVRKAEGGIRATSYKNCYSINENGVDYHRPIFFYTDETKRNYEKAFNITHSRCYTEYGMTRTGCAGCPLNMKIGEEIHTIQEYEPRLHGAVNKIFADTYEYTRKYREFQKEMRAAAKGYKQLTVFDVMKGDNNETISTPN